MGGPKIRNCFYLLTVLLFFAACKTNESLNFQDRLSVKSDTLYFNNHRDTLVFGSKGTALFFENGSFVLPDGSSPKGLVSIQLKECYSLSDIVRENLSTASNNQLLETSGMIY